MADSARKAVVRDLPPTLPAEVFWKAVEPWVRTEPETARTAKHTSYVQGKRAEQPGVWDTPSVAYIEFLTPALLLAFATHFHGHIFRDSKGHDFVAFVDVALIQSCARWAPTTYERYKGAVEHAPEYKAFVASLEAPPAKAMPDKPADKADAPVTTPLVEYMRQKQQPPEAPAKNRQEPPKTPKPTKAPKPKKDKAAKAPPKSAPAPRITILTKPPPPPPSSHA